MTHGPTPRPVDLPLARAHAHLLAARHSEAVGAFRAAISVDPKVVYAHLGLADALFALGRRREAAEGLVGAAEAFSGRQEPADALTLLGKALAVDPCRLELHLDLAMTEEALGRHDAAVARIEGLADLYMDGGRFEEAGELLRLLASWADEAGEAHGPAVAPALEATPAPEVAMPEVAMPEVAPRNTALITGETVIALNPLLLVRAPVRPASEAEAELDMESRVTLVHGGASRPQSDPSSAPRLVPARPDVVQRLRARAGLGQASGSPRRASARATEPITIRTAVDRPPVQDEDVTRYFRRPQGLDAAS